MKRIVLLITILLLSSIFIMVAYREHQRKSIALRPTSYAQQLFESRNLYIGNNSADGKILSLLNIRRNLGNFKIELQTTQEPYRIKLNFLDKVTDRTKFDLLMRKYAFMLLALIDNAGEVQWSYPYDEGNREIRMNANASLEAAKNILGKDIKEYGKTPSQVQELLNKLEVRN